tara:strand:- start:891 stop:2387 length:1497 start_codon:yes stop_codon:yes gene_type:complete
MENAIKLNGIYKSFDNNNALVDTFFSANWGEVHALLGENGAGKSTLMNIVSGLYLPDKGKIFLEDKQVDITSPINSQSMGIGMVHQHFKLIRNMTVAENLILVHGKGNWRESQEYILTKIDEINKIGLAIKPDSIIERLSVAEQQRVEIAKVLIGGAKILILDEPTAVLTDKEADTLLNQMRTFASDGRCVVIITHKLREVIQFADKVTVMRSGKTVANNKNAKNMSANDLSRLMVGEAKEYKKVKSNISKIKALKIQNLSIIRENETKAIDDLSLNLFEGQIYGLAGVSGNGQTELAEFLMGLCKPLKGKIFVANENLKKISPQNFRAHGIASIPAERYIYGLAGDLSVMENFSIAQIDHQDYGNPFWVNNNSMINKTNKTIKDFNILGALPYTKARILSGGNAQKLVLARELSSDSKILIAHSPTRGLDVRACVSIHENLRKAANLGVAVLLISEDLDEIMSVADYIGVINRGRIVGEFISPADRHELGKLMTDHA